SVINVSGDCTCDMAFTPPVRGVRGGGMALGEGACLSIASTVAPGRHAGHRRTCESSAAPPGGARWTPQRTDISELSKHKIISDNSRRVYGLSPKLIGRLRRISTVCRAHCSRTAT